MVPSPGTLIMLCPTSDISVARYLCVYNGSLCMTKDNITRTFVRSIFCFGVS